MFAIIAAATNETLMTLDDMQEAYTLVKRSNHVEPLVILNMDTGAEALFCYGMLAAIKEAGPSDYEIDSHSHYGPYSTTNCYDALCRL